MGTTEVQAAAEELEITELEKFEVDRIDGVASPANGTPILLMKSLTPGLDGGEEVPDAIAQRAREASAVVRKAFLSIKGDWEYPADAVAKASRTFSAADRRRNAAAGTALDDGTYPMPDADAVRRAAYLIRAKKGKWKAAAKLLARRVGQLGIPNPLKKKPKAAGAGKSAAVAKEGAGVDTGAQDKQIATLVTAEVAKALKPHEEREQALEAELAKANERIAEFAAMPREGGPVLSVTRPGDGVAVKKAQLLLQAEEREQMARTVTNPDDAAGYAQRAAELRAEAATLGG